MKISLSMGDSENDQLLKDKNHHKTKKTYHTEQLNSAPGGEVNSKCSLDIANLAMNKAAK